MTRIKICGITNAEDMDATLALGVDYVGIVQEPSSPRYVENPSSLVRQAAGRAAVIAVFGPYIENEYVQLFDSIQTISDARVPNLLRIIRIGEPGVDNSVEGLNGPILLDAYCESAFGGSGKVSDWDVAADLAARYDGQVFLAGGLTADKVAEAIRRVRPFAVDVSSGVEAAPGTKDACKLRAFVDAVRSVQD